MKRLLAVLAVGAGATADAQTVATSAAPDAVSVTIYRNPNRSMDEAVELDWLHGYAFITEQRRLSIPAGDVELRFEGVAGGIIPQSAIVTGLPDGVVEKNQDAFLLSPYSLLDASLGKRVTLRRTSRATGQVREQEAIVMTAADGAVVLRTEEGFEALRCTGLPEKLVYSELPKGLSAKPTLSVRTRATRPVMVTATLSYLATGFDWQANYIGTLAPSGDRMDVFTWVTLANGDETSFVNANTQTVAGKIERQRAEEEDEDARQILLRCWPSGRTHQAGAQDFPPPPPPPPPPPASVADFAAEDGDYESIVVTGLRTAVQEDLGDLKLYRLPEPVTVASQSQKQVAMFERKAVKVGVVYRTRVEFAEEEESLEIERVLKARNRKQDGLGLPLPGGSFTLFAAGYGRPVLIGEGSLADKAVDEDVEIRLNEVEDIIARVEEVEVDEVERDGKSIDTTTYALVVTNPRAEPVTFEAQFDFPSEDDDEDGELIVRGRGVTARNGRKVWAATVPANGTARFEFRTIERY